MSASGLSARAHVSMNVAIIFNMYYVSNSKLALLENGHLQIHSNDCYNFSLDKLMLSGNPRSFTLDRTLSVANNPDINPVISGPES